MTRPSIVDSASFSQTTADRMRRTFSATHLSGNPIFRHILARVTRSQAHRCHHALKPLKTQVEYSLAFDARRGKYRAARVIVLHSSAAVLSMPPENLGTNHHKPASHKRGVRGLFVDALTPWIPTQLDLLETDGDLCHAAVDSGVLWEHLLSYEKAEMV